MTNMTSRELSLTITHSLEPENFEVLIELPARHHELNTCARSYSTSLHLSIYNLKS
jgi:hypothetical protein